MSVSPDQAVCISDHPSDANVEASSTATAKVVQRRYLHLPLRPRARITWPTAGMCIAPIHASSSFIATPSDLDKVGAPYLWAAQTLCSAMQASRPAFETKNQNQFALHCVTSTLIAKMGALSKRWRRASFCLPRFGNILVSRWPHDILRLIVRDGGRLILWKVGTNGRRISSGSPELPGGRKRAT